jgi:hypothetical protein
VRSESVGLGLSDARQCHNGLNGADRRRGVCLIRERLGTLVSESVGLGGGDGECGVLAVHYRLSLRTSLCRVYWSW